MLSAKNIIHLIGRLLAFSTIISTTVSGQNTIQFSVSVVKPW